MGWIDDENFELNLLLNALDIFMYIFVLFWFSS